MKNTMIGLRKKPMKSPIGLNINIIPTFISFNTDCNIGDACIDISAIFFVSAKIPPIPTAILPNFKIFLATALLPPSNPPAPDFEAVD